MESAPRRKGSRVPRLVAQVLRFRPRLTPYERAVRLGFRPAEVWTPQDRGFMADFKNKHPEEYAKALEDAANQMFAKPDYPVGQPSPQRKK